MKRKYLNLAAMNKNRMPKMVSRRIFGTAPDSFRAGAAYRSDEDDDDDDDEEDDKPKGETAVLLRKVKKICQRELKGMASKADSDAISKRLTELLEGTPAKDGNPAIPAIPIEALREWADPKTGITARVTSMGAELQKIKGMFAEGDGTVSVRKQCENYLKENEAAIKSLRGGQSGAWKDLKPFELKLRAASNPMLPSNVMPSGTTHITKFQVESGYVSELRNDPTFWDFIRKPRTSAETYFWVNKKKSADTGEAAFTAPGGLKPAVSWIYETESSVAKKITVLAKMAIELLEDVDGFNSHVEEELAFQLYDKANLVLCGAGAATSTDPEGLQHMSTTYVDNGFKTKDPNFWDVMLAGVNMLRVKKFRGAILALVHPTDHSNAKATKANTQGQLFIAPNTGAIVLDDLNATQGSVQFVATNYYNVRIYKPFVLRWGLDGTDFSHNQITSIAEMRLHVYHSENHDGFAIYDTIANIKAAITEV